MCVADTEAHEGVPVLAAIEPALRPFAVGGHHTPGSESVVRGQDVGDGRIMRLDVPGTPTRTQV